MRDLWVRPCLRFLASTMFLIVTACSDAGTSPPPSAPVTTPGTSPGSPTPAPEAPTSDDGVFASAGATARFISQSTFGEAPGESQSLTGTAGSDWFRAELDKPASLNLPFVLNFIAQDQAQTGDDDGRSYTALHAPTFSFWRNAIEGDDQLRQRMAFALSQILVISGSNDELFNFPEAIAYYQDILTRNAFGNYRDLIEEVTYSPAMGVYLTYLQNRAGDPATGRTPDENYARELLQLFTIGLVELDSSGEPVLGIDGQPIELFTNDDITGLAKVFTGLSLQGQDFFFNFGNISQTQLTSPMDMFDQFHSDLEKRFLGATIPANTAGRESIDQALDVIFSHPNVGPFVGRQIIQRFTTSNPSPDYVRRVAAAFDAGSFTLPDGSTVGTGTRGDLAATLAAVMFDDDARSDEAREDNSYGKIREPILRFVQWARAFNVSTVTPEFTFQLWDAGGADELGQHPYQSPSVFNFYRPGYVAPGTLTGNAGLTAPELQIVNATSVAGYSNFITWFVFEEMRFAVDNELIAGADARASFRPDYSTELSLASNPSMLVEHLNSLLAQGDMTANTRSLIQQVVEDIPLTEESDPNYDGPLLRVRTAVAMAMTAPEVIIQR